MHVINAIILAQNALEVYQQIVHLAFQDFFYKEQLKAICALLLAIQDTISIIWITVVMNAK